MRADFRSDTLTQPTEAMREAMNSAPLGDDVFNEDPSIIALEEKVAKLFGKEAALFCPSGTMTNQIAIRMHTQPGDEVICDQLSHIYLYEGGGIAHNSGASVRLLNGDRGRLSLDQVKSAVNPDDPHFPKSRLLSLENTCNKGGGSIYALSQMRELSLYCRENDLGIHLDGARLFNAIVESDYDTSDVGECFDSISVCFSKGLGAPVGSALISSRENIHRARRIRKVFGGGMRQAGMLAAAASFALENHIDRLKEDHKRAKTLEQELSALPYVRSIAPVDTNIVILEIDNTKDSVALMTQLAERGVQTVGFGPQKIRLVTHLDLDDQIIEYSDKVFRELV